jgi:hypothetical protein
MAHARVGDGLGGYAVDGHHVIAVDGDDGEVEFPGFEGNVFDLGVDGGTFKLAGVAQVGDENHGQPAGAGGMHGLMPGIVGCGIFRGEGNDDLAVLLFAVGFGGGDGAFEAEPAGLGGAGAEAGNDLFKRRLGGVIGVDVDVLDGEVGGPEDATAWPWWSWMLMENSGCAM